MTELKPEDKLRLDAKLDEMRKKRAGKSLSLNVTLEISNKAINFQHTLNEMRELCEMHQLIPPEVWALGAQLQWLANDINVNQKVALFGRNLEKQLNEQLFSKGKTPEEKKVEKHEKEVEEGKIRVPPGTPAPIVDTPVKQEKKLPGGKEVALLNEQGNCSKCSSIVIFDQNQNECVCHQCNLDFTLDYHKKYPDKNSEVPKKE